MSSNIIDLCDEDELEIAPRDVLDLTQEKPAGQPASRKTSRKMSKRKCDEDKEDEVVLMGERKSMQDEAGPSNRQQQQQQIVTTVPSSLNRPPLATLTTEDEATPFTLDCGCSFKALADLQSLLLERTTATTEGASRDPKTSSSMVRGKKKAQGPPSPPPTLLDKCNCSKCSKPLSHRDIRNLLPNIDNIYQEAASCPLGGPRASIPIRALLDELRVQLLTSESGGGKRGGKHKASKSKSQGIGYGGGQNESGTLKVAKGLEAASKRQDAHDQQTIATLEGIRDLIRGSMEGDVVNRSQPPPSYIMAHVFSSLPFLLRLLLSNDSMTDLARRQPLVRSVIDLLRLFSTSSDLVEVFLICTRDFQAHDDGEPSTSNAQQEPPTIFAIMQQLNRQCLIYRRSALALGDGDEACISALSLTLELSSLYDDVAQSVNLFCLSMGQKQEGEKEQPGKGERRKRKVEPITESVRDQRYVSSMKNVQFCEVGGLQGTHFFRQEASKSKGGGGEVMRKRLRRITEEVSTLSTSLPAEFDSCICLAVDDERMDLLRAVIFPASDTPYANGAFLFDIFIPNDYPQAPPKVQFLTTGGGAVRFNPNLYADGKVCLSLLGTWQGPSWDPATSTLLQVLISIQSMILVSDPFFNEPGFEKRAATAQGREESRAYNEELRTETLRLAILPMFELALGQNSGKPSSSTPSPLSTFTNAIKIHVEAKRDLIVDQFKTWVNDCKNKTSKSSMKTVLDKIRKLTG